MNTAKQNIIFAVLATDIALFTVKDNQLFVRIITVNRPPHFPGIPGLPGGLISPTETADQAVERLIQEKAHIQSSKVYFEQLYTFSSIDRDPRGRVVSVAYLALVPWEELSISEQEKIDAAYWQPVFPKQNLAYDHNEVLSLAIKRLRSRIIYTSISSKLVPKEFTLTHLEQTCEVVLGKEIDKRNFRKKLLSLEVLKKCDRQLRGVKHRPANLYKFSSAKVIDIQVL